MLTSDIPCEACNGSGRVALNSWPLLTGMKDTLRRAQQVVTPFEPPLFIETEANPGDF